MEQIKEAMLAHECTDKNKLRFPLLVTPKLDGIRCLKINGVAVSRTFKPIRQQFIAQTIEFYCPWNVDGEIIIPGKKFNEISSIVMTNSDEVVEFQYWIFDYVKDAASKKYCDRIIDLMDMPVMDNGKFIVKLIPVCINNLQELDQYEEQCIQEGYEGICIRSPTGPYKFGRSTEKEQYLLKIKRFKDREAIVLGYEEAISVEGDPKDTLGAIYVKDYEEGWEFKIGTGFDGTIRSEIWNNKEKYLGAIIKYKYQPHGVERLPRFPVFLGFRYEEDI